MLQKIASDPLIDEQVSTDVYASPEPRGPGWPAIMLGRAPQLRAGTLGRARALLRGRISVLPDDISYAPCRCVTALRLSSELILKVCQDQLTGSGTAPMISIEKSALSYVAGMNPAYCGQPSVRLRQFGETRSPTSPPQRLDSDKFAAGAVLWSGL
jgi:hypothetical protein